MVVKEWNCHFNLEPHFEREQAVVVGGFHIRVIGNDGAAVGGDLWWWE